MPVVKRGIRRLKNLNNRTLGKYGNNVCEHLQPQVGQDRLAEGVDALAYRSELHPKGDEWSIGCLECAPSGDYDWGTGPCGKKDCENSDRDVQIFPMRIASISRGEVYMMCKECKNEWIEKESLALSVLLTPFDSAYNI